MDTDLQVTLVDEIKANEQLTEIMVSSKQLYIREKVNNPQGDVRETEKQVDRERVNLNEAISFAQKKKDELEEAKNKSPLKVVGGALIGGLVAGPFGIIGAGVGAVAGAGVCGTVAYADIEQADKAVDEAWSAKRRAEERLESKQRDLRKVKLDLEGLKKQGRKKAKKGTAGKLERLRQKFCHISGYHYITN